MSGGAGYFKRRLERAVELRSYRGAGINAEEEAELEAAEAQERDTRKKVDDAQRAEYLIRDAMAQGKFDNLKYAGKPIPGLGAGSMCSSPKSRSGTSSPTSTPG